MRGDQLVEITFAEPGLGLLQLGIFRNVNRPTYDGAVNTQLEEAKSRLGEGDLNKLITSHGTWTVDGDSQNGG